MNKKFINRGAIALVLTMLLLASVSAAIMRRTAQAASTVTITGNTSAGENVPGWMFNRDPSTTSPYEFNADTAKIGAGSLYVPPISGSPASNKFIGENFMVTPLSDVNSISFDFKLAPGSNLSDGQHFYMNVYTNFAESDDLKFYDCRYNVIATVGSTSDWTTLTFNPASAHNVTPRASSPHTCPNVPNDMDNFGAGSNIRAFSISVGDTSASDAGVSGYLDNVVVNLDSTGVTTYDLEPSAPAAPTLVYPGNNSKVNASSPIANDWNDVADVAHYVYQSYNVDGSGSCNLSDVRFTGNFTDSNTNSRVIADGLTFCWRVKAVGTNGLESEWSSLWKVTIDNSSPSVPTMVYHEEPSGDEVLNGGLTNSQNFVFNLNSASDTTRYQLKYWNDIVGSPFKEASPWNPTDLSGYSSALGVYHDNFTQGPGVHYFAFSACDGAGNCSAYSAPFVVDFDNVAPGVPVNGQPHNTYLDTNSFNFTWDAVVDAATYEFQSSLSPSQSGGVLNSGVWNNVANGNSSQNHLTSPMIPSSGAPDGTWYWQVRAIDEHGNASAWSEIWNVTLDTVAPTVPVHQSPADGTVTTTANQTLIDWDDSSDASPVHYIYESSLSSAINPDGSFVVPVYTSGALSDSQIPTPGTPEGSYFWHVRAVDAAGNQSAWSTAWQVIVDNTPPSFSLSADPGDTNDTDTSVGLVTTVPEMGVTYLWTQEGGAGELQFSDASDPNSSVTSSVPGTFTARLTGTDGAGNSAFQDIVLTFTTPTITDTPGGGQGAGADTANAGGGGGAPALANFFGFAGAPGGGDGGAGGAADGGADGGQVQGDNTDTDNDTGNVQAENVATSAATTDGDAGSKLAWWWLLVILAALAAAWYGWKRYRQNQAE